MDQDGLVVSKDGTVDVVIPVPTRKKIQDVSGAGDTVVAVLTAAVASGAASVEAAKMANIAANCVVGRTGTTSIDRDELIACLATPQSGNGL